jgi:phosphoribosylformylglycinamidine (FGAM) synthase-like enzyme
MSNIVTLAVVNTVGDFLIFLGKLSVAVGCGLVAFAMSDAKYYTDAAKVGQSTALTQRRCVKYCTDAAKVGKVLH